MAASTVYRKLLSLAVRHLRKKNRPKDPPKLSCGPLSIRCQEFGTKFRIWNSSERERGIASPNASRALRREGGGASPHLVYSFHSIYFLFHLFHKMAPKKRSRAETDTQKKQWTMLKRQTSNILAACFFWR